jgi:hypothetical protein
MADSRENRVAGLREVFIPREGRVHTQRVCDGSGVPPLGSSSHRNSIKKWKVPLTPETTIFRNTSTFFPL